MVKMPKENITMLARFEHVTEGLKDWRTFSSTSRPWHDPNSVRPELLLTDDPPKHIRVRAVVANALSTKALSKMAEAFERDADAIIARLRPADGEPVDAVTESPSVRLQGAAGPARPATGRPREHARLRQHGLGDDGPINELFNEAMRDTGPVIEWATSAASARTSRPRASAWRCSRPRTEAK